jgi:hypothetical protein
MTIKGGSPMKTKIIAISLLITSTLSILAGCSEGSSEVSEPTPQPTSEATPIERDDIDFTASYDKESTKVIATLTNNTGDDIISYNHGYSIYKKLENGWLKLVGDDAIYSVGLYLFPNDDRNSTEISFPTSLLSGERDSLEAGEYKIDMTVNVYYESETNNLSVDPYDPHEEMTISAEFKVQ